MLLAHVPDRIYYNVAFVITALFITSSFLLSMQDARIGIRLLETGQYEMAIAHYSRLQRQYGPSRKWVFLFNKAVAYHRIGDLASAITALNTINLRMMHRKFLCHYYALYARTLFMMGDDPERAELCCCNALGNEQPSPLLADLFLFRCYQASRENNLTLARSHLIQYQKLSAVRHLVKGPTKIDVKYAALIEDYLLGFHKLCDGDTAEAKKLLQRASEFPYPDLYSTRAKELLSSLNGLSAQKV